MMPIRIQRKRTKGWKLVSPNGLPVVYVGRGTDWGNPFRLDTYGRADAVSAFREWCHPDSALGEAARRILRGKNLACWCALDQPCHADVLLEIANA